MKPKDLKTPFIWSKREVIIDHEQNILHIPKRCDRKDFSKELQNILAGHAQVHIEYCSGNGEWIHQKALLHPDILWIAVEKQFKRVQKIWSKKQNSSLRNLFIVCGEALEASEYYFKSHSVDEVYINFPDPWPKNKHAKFRLVQGAFVKQLYRILKPLGIVNFLTDDGPYSGQAIQTFLKSDLFTSQIGAPFYESEIQDYGSSYFRSLWEEKKRGFYFSKFQKKCKHNV